MTLLDAGASSSAVDLAADNAELRRRLDEALAREAASAEILQVINSSPGDLVPVFDAVVESAMRLCEANYGYLYIYEGGLIHAVAVRGGAEFVEWQRQRGSHPINPGSPVERAFRGEPVVHVADAVQEKAYRTSPAFKELIDRSGIRTGVTVALRKADKFLGTLNVYRREVRPFTEKQIALLQNFAAQAVIAMENARLITETREALEQQTATAEVLGVINASPGDLTPVFDAMLEKAVALCEAAHGVLRTFDGEAFHLAAMYGEPDAVERLKQLGPIDIASIRADDMLGAIVRGEPMVHIADVRETGTYRDNPVARQRAEAANQRTWLAVALRKDGALKGVIMAYRTVVRPFTDKQIALLQNFAAQAVIAMENARLITETREALEQQTATAEVLQVINSSPGDLAPVFDAMLEKALRLCGADEGTLGTFDGELFRLVAARGDDAPILDQYRELGPIGAQAPLFGRFARGERVISVADTHETDVYRNLPDARERIDLRGIRSWLGVALHKDDVLLGVLAIHRKHVQPFTDKQIALLQNFAAQAVIAMENARLITETREALEQQTATAEVLQVINSSPGDLAPVWDAMLEKATRLCKAASGILWLYDGEGFQATALYGVPPPLAEAMLNNPSPRAIPTASLEAIAAGQNVVRDDDLTKNRGADRVVQLGGMRTGFLVALKKGGALLGAIRIFRQEAQPFSEKQIALVQNFAAQAVIAMENARLITETREALEQQTATAEVLGVINSSPGELAPVFDAMLDKGMRLCEADFAGLWTYDGEHVHPAALHRVPAAYAEFMTRHDQPVSPDNTRARLIRGEPFVHIPDAAALPDNPLRRAFVELGGGRAQLAVPLRKDGALVGILTVYRREARPFTDKQIALLQNFAAQAVIAMENARLITETREALEQQTATAEVLQVINSSPGDLVPVFDTILEKAHSLCGATRGTLFLFDGETFRAVAMHGYPQGQPPRSIHVSEDARLASFLAGERLIHIPDLTKLDDPIAQAVAERGGVRTNLLLPLRTDRMLRGVISCNRDAVRPFSDKEIALLENFAAQAVIAMENARLITETREALEQQTATAEVLQVINTSPGDLAPVFDAILEKALELCEASFGTLGIYNGGFVENAAHKGVPARVAEFVRQRQPLRPDTPIGRLFHGETVVHILDITKEGPQPPSPGRRVFVEFGGARTAVWAALRKDGDAVGYFNIYRTEVRPFTEKQIALLQNFAAQAVIAMENARLLGELRQRTDEVAELNRGLEARVAEQVEELGRVGKLKRFLAPQLAELIVSQGDESILESHRREIVVAFCDLRGYTAFTETAEPEEVLDFLREYHGTLGPLVGQFEGTLDQFSGDGIMVFFNDPVPIPDPAVRAVKMAVAMREAAALLVANWRRRGRELGFGVGIAQGYATLGQIGFSERSGYTAIGTVCNVAARLCAEAKDGQILLSQRVAAGLGDEFALEEIGQLALKGLTQPVAAFNVLADGAAS